MPEDALGARANQEQTHQNEHASCRNLGNWGNKKFISHPRISIKHRKLKNAHGDCVAAIAKAAAAVTHAQRLSQEVGSGDGGLGLFGFDLSSAETYFWWLEEEQKEESRPIHGIDLGTGAAEAGEFECCSR